MKWLTLVLAGVLEVAWALAMKYSNGFTELVPSVVTAVGYVASAAFLSLALKELPLGTAYFCSGKSCRCRKRSASS